MKKMLVVVAFAALAANPCQVEAVVPRHMPRGAWICNRCDGEGRVRCGFLLLDSKRCPKCDGHGFLLPAPPPPPKPRHVAPKPPKPRHDGRKPDMHHKPGAPAGKPPAPKPQPPKGGKGPR